MLLRHVAAVGGGLQAALLEVLWPLIGAGLGRGHEYGHPGLLPSWVDRVVTWPADDRLLRAQRRPAGTGRGLGVKRRCVIIESAVDGRKKNEASKDWSDTNKHRNWWM